LKERMMIEAGVVAGYVIAWAVRKARRAAGRLDRETDGVIDASLDRLHEVVAAKLGGHPVLAEIVEEAEATGDGGGVSDLTRQEAVRAIANAAEEDDGFGQVVKELVFRLRQAEQAEEPAVMAGPGSAVFTGSAEARAESGGIAFGQVAGDVYVAQGAEDPSRPRRAGH
jgi:hypothetical protein